MLGTNILLKSFKLLDLWKVTASMSWNWFWVPLGYVSPVCFLLGCPNWNGQWNDVLGGTCSCWASSLILCHGNVGIFSKKPPNSGQGALTHLVCACWGIKGAQGAFLEKSNVWWRLRYSEIAFLLGIPVSVPVCASGWAMKCAQFLGPPPVLQEDQKEELFSFSGGQSGGRSLPAAPSPAMPYIPYFPKSLDSSSLHA